MRLKTSGSAAGGSVVSGSPGAGSGVTGKVPRHQECPRQACGREGVLRRQPHIVIGEGGGGRTAQQHPSQLC